MNRRNFLSRVAQTMGLIATAPVLGGAVAEPTKVVAKYNLKDLVLTIGSVRIAPASEPDIMVEVTLAREGIYSYDTRMRL